MEIRIQPQTQAPLWDRAIASLSGFTMSRASLIPKVMKLTADPNAAPAEMSRVLSSDPALSATVLRLSNSSFYGRVRSVNSLSEAITILGVSLLRSLVVATSMSTLFRSPDDEYEECLWNHSLAVAIAARLTARRIKTPHEEELFLAGLMHDLAQLILLEKFPEEYRPVLSEIRAGARDVLVIERERLGFTHQELAATILSQWNFPPRLTETVRHHHDPDVPSTLPGSDEIDTEVGQLKHALCFADHLADDCGFGSRPVEDSSIATLPSTHALELTAKDITAISQELKERYAEEQRLLSE